MGDAPPVRTGSVRIERLAPVAECRRVPVKRFVGDEVVTATDVFRDGHEVLRAVVQYRAPRERRGRRPRGRRRRDRAGVRWGGVLTVGDVPGRWEYTSSPGSTSSRRGANERRKLAAARRISRASSPRARCCCARSRSPRARRPRAADRAAAVLEAEDIPEALNRAAGHALLARTAERDGATTCDAIAIDGRPVLARFGSWYELFPRSWGGSRASPGSSRLAGARVRRALRPPIHPIGRTNRKGRNNALVAGPDDPGSPWAIGAPEGGHTAVHPELGTPADFGRWSPRACARHGGRARPRDPVLGRPPVADRAPGVVPPRPDGTLKYAENPPKRYQDIYNVRLRLRRTGVRCGRALRDGCGSGSTAGSGLPRRQPAHQAVGVLGVADRACHDTHPEVIFLAEAFTRRAVMRELAQGRLHQSYTYFTWKSTAPRPPRRARERARARRTPAELLRQHAGHPHRLARARRAAAFATRAVLAATLSPTWGVYSGFEYYEHEAVRPGSEEYLDSEKY